MARPIRFQYPGAIYHVMARGDGGKLIFESKEDCEVFLARLSEACSSCGWQIHAWVLMGNHFHLLLETPQANLVKGMKWLLGVFSQGWNRARGRKGHVFQGRYKSIPVNDSEADPSYFRTLADYIHLNPARAGLAGGKHGNLASYQWSSLSYYATGKHPQWLVTERVLQAFELSRDGRGRRAYLAWLESKADEGGLVSEKAQAALERGWYLGDDTFKDKLLDLKDAFIGMKMNRERAISVDALREHGERDAERLIMRFADRLGIPDDSVALEKLPKGDLGKAQMALLLARRTTVSRKWMAKRLAMGHPGSVSRQIGIIKQNEEWSQPINEIEEKFC